MSSSTEEDEAHATKSDETTGKPPLLVTKRPKIPPERKPRPFSSELSQITPVIKSRETMSIRPNISPLEIDGTSSGNLSVKWKTWIKQFRLYIIAAGLEDETDKRKVALLLSLIGEQGLNVFNTFGLDDETAKLEEVTDKFEKYFNPKTNLTVERHNFFSRQQKPGESVDEFVTALKNLASTCALEKLKDSLVTDILILGLRKDNVHMKERLLQEEDLKLETAIKICRSLELSKIQAQEMDRSPGALAVNKVATTYQQQQTHRSNNDDKGRNRTKFTSRQKHYQQRQRSTSRTRQNSTPRPSSYSRNCHQLPSDEVCGRCGQVHRKKCPAEGVQCSKCFGYNHYAKQCRSRRVVQWINTEEVNTHNQKAADDGSYYVCLVKNEIDPQQPSPEERAVSPTLSEVGSLAESSSCESPPSPPRSHEGRGTLKGDGRRSPPSHLPPPPHQLVLGSGNDAGSTRETGGRTGGGRFPVGAMAPGVVYSQPNSHQHPGSFIVSLNGAPHYLSFPLSMAPPTDLSKPSQK